MRDGAIRLLVGLPLAKLAIHLATHRGYGYFRDEFYYLACADHLAWGYVDQPPLSILLLWVVRSLFGDSLLALRLLPAIAGAGTVLLTGLIARELGGGRFAQGLSMLAAIAAPIFLGIDHFYSMNAFDLLVWPLAAWLLIRVLREPRTGRWIVLGLVLGLGLQNKISVLWLGFGICAGLLLTDRRRLLATRGPWLAGGVAALVFLPHVLWQVANDWPTLEFMSRAAGDKMAGKSLVAFVLEQVLVLNPVALPLWLAGLGFFFVGRDGRPHRALGWTWVAVFLLLAFSGTSRANYLAPAYTWLFAGGAVALETLFARAGTGGGHALRFAAVALLAVSGAALAPFALPLLPVGSYVRYAATLGIAPSTDERKELAELPQFFADMHGWESIVDTVAQVWESLPPDERAEAAIFTPNYGDAGAIDLLGRARGLPRAISGHNNYWLWGARGHSGKVVIVMGQTREDLERAFATVELGAVTDCGYCMPYENRRPIWICRDLRRPFEEIWPEQRHFE